jgi:glycosyltransferase involved in cell wall biosynthesis
MDELKLNIAILGTRGIPNRYGGFEACAEQLATRLTKMGHGVAVYCGHDHEVQASTWKGVKRILKKNPEKLLGSFGQFIYDLYCNLDARKRDFDVILHLGYTSDSIWYRFWTGKSIHLVNMDGMEWKREKYGSLTKRFLRWAESLATLRADALVADNPAIEAYLAEKYTRPVHMIPYGAIIPGSFSQDILREKNLRPHEYDLMVARMEPENNIREAIEAKLISGDDNPLVITANRNKYASSLQKIYGAKEDIIFTGPVYEAKDIQSLRHYSRYYIHGHSAGGTNPSLLEAMACGCNIIAHHNVYNEAVLGNNATYFYSKEELARQLSYGPAEEEQSRIQLNINKIRDVYSWERVTRDYEKLMQHAIKCK